ncbi:hypothetical protein BWQ96_10638 [Gracilariopsis chorda]|uniref:Methyltransferase domain-containing protein n=1 Tax=Gracilariopsis chorda TaxID=448386 RepID=A0A2V3IC63_9FLOR|nr:hypothetical protein BWQ96_10638 [Gracilariopsis chorda]|eukprot:PXF39661.1 hypothetical protein BWQ96_10638 [Gracilariopsis chorda]
MHPPSAEGHVNATDVFVSCSFGKQAVTKMSTKDKQKVYAQWSETYEQDVLDNDYVAWPICAEKIFAVMSNMASEENISRPFKLVDVGCGTGYLGTLVSDRLKSTDISAFLVGVDFSSEMLEKARNKKCYDKLIVADINHPLPTEARAMDIAVAMGVFVEGHCDASALPNVLACLRKNGIALITIRSTTIVKFEQEYLQAVADSKCEIVQRDEQMYFGPAKAEYWTVRKTV